jgi:uncharacterized protein (TIGR04255 family)
MEPNAVRLTNDEETRSVLVADARLTFSVLAHYDQWETLVNGAFATWRLYEEATAPLALVRLSTRFVNRFSKASTNPLGLFNDSFDVPIPGASLTGLHDRRSGRTSDGFDVSVSRRLVTPATVSRNPIVYFDVEASRSYDEELEIPITKDRIADDLARLRELKNTLFYESVDINRLDHYLNES